MASIFKNSSISSDSEAEGVFNGIATDEDTTEELSRMDINSSEKVLPLSVKDVSKRGTDNVVGPEDFLTVLRRLRVPGPFDLIDHLIEPNILGKGGQFTVYRSNMLEEGNVVDNFHPVAVKRTCLPIGTDRRFDLQSAESKKFIRDMYLEVVALMDPGLRRHRNIVNLIGWSSEYSLESTPLLVMELAINSLDIFLLKEVRLEEDLKQTLCLDMGCGLDALHDSGVMHGDLKPGNVLVFKNYEETSNEISFIAKLADFGLAVSDTSHSEGNKIKVLGLSRQWCAPEMPLKTELTASEFCSADNYSYGLVIWSTFCLKGQPPPSTMYVQSAWRSDLETQSSRMLPVLSETIIGTLSELLKHDPQERPERVAGLLLDDSKICFMWKQQYKHAPDYELSKSSDTSQNSERRGTPSRAFLPDISTYFLEGLGASFDKYDTLAADTCFAIFLLGSSLGSMCQDVRIGDLFLRSLLKSARLGYPQAQAIVGRIFQYCGLALPPDCRDTRLLDHLCIGASAGCRIAYADLLKVDQGLALSCTAKFRREGGYQQYMCSASEITAYASTRAQLKQPCWDEDTKSLLRTDDSDSSARSLYDWQLLLSMACLAGDTQTVRTLCTSDKSTDFGLGSARIAPIHWLFMFPDTDIAEVASLFINSGSNPNHQTYKPVADCNYPYCWPRGSPLHWAVTAGNTTAVKALLDLGADPLLCNGSDPYRYDQSVRIPRCTGTYAEADYSNSPSAPVGLSPLDLAVAELHHDIVKAIKESGLRLEQHITDEEGYTPMHRFQQNLTAHTYQAIHYWRRPFLGDQMTAKQMMRRVITMLKDMGGDINAVTSSRCIKDKDQAYSRNRGNHTPLYLAIEKGDVLAVEALLECGADPNLLNSGGYNAFGLLPTRNDPLVNEEAAATMIELLLRYGTKLSTPSVDFRASPLTSVVRCGSIKGMDMIYQAGADPGTQCGGLNAFAWMMAADERKEWTGSSITRDLDMAAVFGKHFPPLSIVNADHDGGTLLHHAAYGVRLGCVRAMLSKIRDPGIINITRIHHSQEFTADTNSILRYHTPYGTALDLVYIRQLQIINTMARNSRELSDESKSLL